MTVIEHDGHRLEIIVDYVDVTSNAEPDPGWIYTDDAGHIHRWEASNEEWNNPAGPRAILPSIVKVVDYAGDHEYPERSHYECVWCGSPVRPGMRPPLYQRTIARRRFVLDGRTISEAEAEAWSTGVLVKLTIDIHRAEASGDKA